MLVGIFLWLVREVEGVLTEAMERMEHRKSKTAVSFMLSGW